MVRSKARLIARFRRFYSAANTGYDHSPLRAIARFLETPPAAVAPSYLEPSDRATLSIATDLEAVLARAHADRNALPLLTPTLIQMAAIAVAFTAQRLLPFPTQHEALHQLVGLMQQRVLANTHKDNTFADRSPVQHFLRACDHFSNVRRWITCPTTFPAELLHVRRELADFSVYLAFATYTSGPAARISGPQLAGQSLSCVAPSRPSR